MACLQAWQWPGNVRELENLVERMVNLCEGMEISQQDLPEEMRQGDPVAQPASGQASLHEKERQHVLEVLSANKGNMRQSARLLGISRTALYNKLNQWQVDLIALRKNMRSPV